MSRIRCLKLNTYRIHVKVFMYKLLINIQLIRNKKLSVEFTTEPHFKIDTQEFITID